MALREEKVSVTSGKKKASVRKETVAFSATIPKIVRKNQNTLPPRLPSRPFHEVEVCQRREVFEAKVTMGPVFDNRVDIIWRVLAHERLVNIGIRPSAIFLKKNKTGCKSGDMCMFPQHKVDEQPNKRPKKGNFPKRRESEDKGAVAFVRSERITIGLCITRLGCPRFSRNERVSGKPDAESLERNSKSSIH